MKTLIKISASLLLFGLMLLLASANKNNKLVILAKPFTYAGHLSTSLNHPPDGDKTLSPYFFVQNSEGNEEQMPLKSTKADVTISGMIADVTITQTYCNEGKSTIEAIYIFPASTRAAVYAMKMTIGERTIQAVIKEKEQARIDYDNAKNAGKTASLLEQQRPNVFQMNVANILPGDKIEVVLSYTEFLIPENGMYEFVYPTVVSPRYSNKKAELASANDKWLSNPYLHQDTDPNYTFNITTTINSGIPVKEVRCMSHQIDVQYPDKSKVVCALKSNETYGGNRDYILQYRLTENNIETGMLLYEGKDENFFVAVIEPPQKKHIIKPLPREYIFIIDVSGSMYGFPLDITKSLMTNLFQKLQPKDRFNVVLFAGCAALYSQTSLQADENNINEAIKFINRQQGSGGTELLPALKTALNLPFTEGYSRSVVIATDGYVDVEKEAFDVIRQNLSKANFFAIGIGSSVNRYLIEGMAHVGMGIPFIATNQNEGQQLSGKIIDYIENPVLTGISLKFQGFETYDVEPLSIPDVLSNRPVVVFGKWKGKPSGSLYLKSTSANGNYEKRIDIASVNPDKSNIALTYLWARERIKFLDDYASFGDNAAIKKEVTELGLKYNLLTQYTSFIAIDENIRNKDGKSTTVVQPLPLPQGVSDYAIGYPSGNSAYAPCKMSQGSRLKGVTTGSYDMKEETEVFSIVEETPKFKGGDAALQNFIKTNLTYPETAKNNNISGTVYVSFVVSKTGELKDIKITKGVHSLLDNEALRIVKLMAAKRLWIAGKQSGKAIDASFNLPIKFVLEK